MKENQYNHTSHGSNETRYQYVEIDFNQEQITGGSEIMNHFFFVGTMITY